MSNETPKLSQEGTMTQFLLQSGYTRNEQGGWNLPQMKSQPEADQKDNDEARDGS